MPVLTGVVQAEGALVEVGVAWGDAAARAQRAALSPVPPSQNAQALLDTGAESTCLDSALVQALSLPLARMALANVPAVGGLTFSRSIKVNLTVRHPSGDLSRHLLFHDIFVLDVSLGTLGYQVLLGRDALARDALARCAFLYHGRRGRFRLSY